MDNRILSLFGNNLTHTLNRQLKEKIKEYFPELTEPILNQGVSLQRYIQKSPEKYYNKELFYKYYAFLKSSCSKKDINEKSTEIDIAIKTMSEINSKDIHENSKSTNEFQSALYINDSIVPQYLKTLESIYHIFIYFIALNSRRQRKKGTDNLDIYNCNDELKQTDFKDIQGNYNNTIRNGIAHGKILFYKDEIEFYDKKGKRVKQDISNFIRLFDDLIDVCNAFCLAMKIYLLNNPDLTISKHFTVQEIKKELDSPWWSVEGILESKIINNKNQLIIFCESHTTDISKLQFYSFLTALYSEFFLKGFDVYFISIRSKVIKGPGWARLDGKLLRKNRKSKNVSMDNYEGVFLDGGVFALLKYKLPKIVYKINSLYHSFKLHMPLAFDEIKKNLNPIDISVRDAKIHRNKMSLILNANIIINHSNINENMLFELKRKIIRKCLRKAKYQKRSAINFLQLGYCRINIFNEDMRERKLNNHGLGKKLIGTLEVKRIKRINVPNIYSGKEYLKGKYKVVINQNYIKDDI